MNEDKNKFSSIKSAALKLGEFDRAVIFCTMDSNGRINMMTNGHGGDMAALLFNLQVLLFKRSMAEITTTEEKK